VVDVKLVNLWLWLKSQSQRRVKVPQRRETRRDYLLFSDFHHRCTLYTLYTMSAVTKPFSKAPRYVDWARPHTWKDPNYTKPNYAAAFQLIREILTEKPRPFHAIVEAGLQRHAASQPGSSSSASAKSASPVQGGRMTPAKKKLAKKDGLQVIPEGHPFVSNKSVAQLMSSAALMTGF